MKKTITANKIAIPPTIQTTNLISFQFSPESTVIAPVEAGFRLLTTTLGEVVFLVVGGV